MLRCASSAPELDISHKRWSWFREFSELDMTGGVSTQFDRVRRCIDTWIANYSL